MKESFEINDHKISSSTKVNYTEQKKKNQQCYDHTIANL